MTKKERIKNAAEKVFFGVLTLVGLWGTIRAFNRRSYTDPAPINHTEPKRLEVTHE